MSGALTRTLRVMASGNLFADQVDASSVLDSYDDTSIGFTGRLSTIWNLTSTTELMFSGFYRSPRDIPYGEIHSMSFSSFSIKRSFLNDRLAVTLKANDIFNNMGFS